MMAMLRISSSGSSIEARSVVNALEAVVHPGSGL
jgi:hypothetical protein